VSRNLVIGFGNLYRRDDGVGFVVLNAVRDPELAELIAGYDRVVFLDAHVGLIPDPIREERIEARYRPGTVFHQLLPSTLLSVAQETYGHCPEGILLSIKGNDFDFGEELSPETAVLVPQATIRVMALLGLSD